jgi:hypothetical protein
MPLFIKRVSLDENALMPLLSKPGKGYQSTRLLRSHENLPRTTSAVDFLNVLEHNLEKHTLPRETWTFVPAVDLAKENQTEHEGCSSLVSTFLKGKANPERQCMLWFVDYELLPVALDYMLLLDESKWLSRDVIFVHMNMSQTCRPSQGINEWLSLYHLGEGGRGGGGGSSSSLDLDLLDTLPSTRKAALVSAKATRSNSMPNGGNVAAAFVLSQQQQQIEIGGDDDDDDGDRGRGREKGKEKRKKDILISINSGRGLLPNLDLITTLKMVWESVSSSVSYSSGAGYGSSSHSSLSMALEGMESCEDSVGSPRRKCRPPQSFQEHVEALRCLSTFYLHHWRGPTSKLHSRMFRDFNIDSLELSVTKDLLGNSSKRLRMRHLLEGFTRALNNVEEKLHHSTYTYMLFSLGCSLASPLAWIWFLVLLVALAALPTAMLLLSGGLEEDEEERVSAIGRKRRKTNAAVAAAASTATAVVLSATCFSFFQDPLLVYSLCGVAFPASLLLCNMYINQKHQGQKQD